MEKTKTFIEYLQEQDFSSDQLESLNESLQSEWTPELEAKVDAALEEFVKQYQNEDGSYDIESFNVQLTNEGLFGSIFGGLTGFALGKSVGKTIAKVLGVQKGVMYDMLTSRLVGAALGAAIGSKM
jgi:hypothetical protein